MEYVLEYNPPPIVTTIMVRSYMGSAFLADKSVASTPALLCGTVAR
jgi:hypothetical protein